jgi:site-specific recombinase XerD
MIVMLWRGMLRCSESLALLPKDFDPEAGTVRVLHGKGNKARVVGIDPTASAVIARWLDVRRKKDITGRARLFCTLDGKPLLSPYVRGLLPRLASKAGIEKRVHAHGLRHSGAVELANEGIPLHVIQRQLCHSNVATTSRYIAHISANDVVKAMRSRTWGNA